MGTEKELLERIHRLEEQNGILQDKLDMIWSILADEYESAAAASDDDGDGEDPPNLIQIDRKNH